ncbi:MAG: histidinol-phosphatase HisJ [Eubacterium sp.]
MIKSNYHIHSTYCDGKNTLEEMTLAAMDAGLISIGFTGHMPLPYKNDWTMTEEKVKDYIAEVKMLKEKYKQDLDIYLGMEIDYFIDEKDISNFAKTVIPELDFFIGSIHTIGRMKNGIVADIDNTPEIFKSGIDDRYHGSTKEFVKAYYKALGEMVLTIHPDIIGHLDLIKKNNTDQAFFNEDEDWYREATLDCLNQIKESGSIIEVNTGGMIRYGARCLYPSYWIMNEIHRLNIPIMLNGDTHRVEGINYAYDESEILLKKIGFKKIMMRFGDKWKPVEF